MCYSLYITFQLTSSLTLLLSLLMPLLTAECCYYIMYNKLEQKGVNIDKQQLPLKPHPCTPTHQTLNIYYKKKVPTLILLHAHYMPQEYISSLLPPIIMHNLLPEYHPHPLSPKFSFSQIRMI